MQTPSAPRAGSSSSRDKSDGNRSRAGFMRRTWWGKSDRALTNVVTALAAAGAAPSHLTRLTWYITDRHAYAANRQAIRRGLSRRDRPSFPGHDHGGGSGFDGSGCGRRDRSDGRDLILSAANYLVACIDCFSTDFRAGHPAWLRCSALKYREYSRLSRLVMRGAALRNSALNQPIQATGARPWRSTHSEDDVPLHDFVARGRQDLQDGSELRPKIV